MQFDFTQSRLGCFANEQGFVVGSLNDSVSSSLSGWPRLAQRFCRIAADQGILIAKCACQGGNR